MHIHIDPVGGFAGDMFAAAVLDAFPEYAAPLSDALSSAGFDHIARVSRETHKDHTLVGSRFIVEATHEGHSHRAYSDIRTLIEDSALARPVALRAIAIFALLADAEAKVHGIAVDSVSFHEVGAWDSIADIVSAAWLIERIGPASWSSAPLPLGGGRVATAHGSLPVPAPATALLLRGLPVMDDGVSGERVTPTGAAIVRHIQPSFDGMGAGARITRTGNGFGTKVFEGLSNIVRLLAFETGAATPYVTEQISVIEFEVDDQSQEDLALGLERVRAKEGVLDVSQSVAYGKKSRLTTSVRVLARPESLDEALRLCLTETATLGVRFQRAERAVLDRAPLSHEVDGEAFRVKRAKRPDGTSTFKVEADDLSAHSGFAARDALRRRIAEGLHGTEQED